METLLQLVVNVSDHLLQMTKIMVPTIHGVFITYLQLITNGLSLFPFLLI